MNILFLEDEELAANKVKALLAAYFDENLTITWVKSVQDGVKYLLNNEMPDLIISDIELLDGNAFSLYENYSVTCPIIFATAYDQFLLKAFQTNGIAYLLKPFDEKQFAQALDKYKKLFQNKGETTLTKDMILDLKQALSSSQKEYKNRFVIKKTSGIFLLNVSDIVCFRADGDLVFAYDNKKNKHIVQNRLSEIETMLDPSKFFRTNRSEIIHIDYIDKIEPFFNNRLVIHLSHFAESIKTSTSKTAGFRKWIEGEG